MAPPSTNHWEKDNTKYNSLLNYIIEQTENVESPMNIIQLVRDFKDKSGAAQTVKCLRRRVDGLRTTICSFEHIDKNTKVKVLFALSAAVNAVLLEHLRKDALVKIDEKKRITHYKANDGSLELKGGHSLYEKLSLINKYFKNKNDDDRVPENEEEKEMANFIEFITEECEKVDSPLSIRQLTKDFNNHFGSSRSLHCINRRVKRYCREIQKTQFLVTSSEVKQLFGLSARLDSNFLKDLRKDAVVEVDELNRVTKYTANDGRLTLHGDHRSSTKQRTAQLASKRSRRSLIYSYFEKKNDADTVPDTEEEKEMGKLIEFISEKCDNVNAPLNITRLIENFIQHFGIARSFDCIKRRVVSYRREIQKIEFLDTPSKVKQLFGLRAKLDLDYLEKLRKDAVVEVNELNKITKYTANNGRLTLYGKHSSSAKRKLNQIGRRKNKNAVKKHCISGDDEGDGYSDSDSEEYSSEEFGSEFDSDDENDPLDEPDHMDSSNEMPDFDNETPGRNGSPTEMSIDDNFDFDPSPEKEDDTGIIGNRRIKKSYEKLSKRRYSDSEDDSDFHPKDSDDENGDQDKTQDLMEPSNEAVDSDNDTSFRHHSPSRISIDDNFDFDPPTERSHISEGTEMRNADMKDDPEITGNAVIKTRSGRLSKRRHLDSNFSYNLANSNSSGALTRSSLSYSKPTKHFDPPTERSHEAEGTEMREDDEKDDPEIPENAAVEPQISETLPRNKTSSSTSHTPKTPKRKADASAESSSSKRTKPLPEESMNSGNSNGNISHDDPPRVESNPFHEPLGLPDETQKDADIQQIPKPRPQVMEAPIEEEYEEESQFSLKTVLKAFKSLVLSLDTSGLLPFQTELDKKIMETGRGAEVSNKEVIMAMDFFIVKLSKHGALKSSEDSISLRDVLLMLRTIILSSSFNCLEAILEMLKKNIEQLKILDKKVPVSKVECVLRATLDSIST